MLNKINQTIESADDAISVIFGMRGCVEESMDAARLYFDHASEMDSVQHTIGIIL